jgi:hypothetical protein
MVASSSATIQNINLYAPVSRTLILAIPLTDEGTHAKAQTIEIGAEQLPFKMRIANFRPAFRLNKFANNENRFA